MTGGDLTIDLSGGDTLTNTGTVNLASGRKMTVNGGSFTQASGGRIMLNNATVEWSGTTGFIAGGALTGTGTLIGPVSNSGGTISPGSSAGVLTLSGNYTQGAGGTLAIELGGTNPGTDFDQFPVSGNAVLAGTLRVKLIDGFTPQAGQQFQILTAGNITGSFASVQTVGFPSNRGASVSTSATTVTVTIVQN
ncbi:MAG: autotransporter outer membrane beta-barrel domain-containing protein [Planctomycetes bacterium]|nr:autotransporter outer membrane beta-barrel domain-containing protein [Planctomycetota bacterium]